VSSANLFHFRWSVPVLAELDLLGGSRFVPLAHRVGVGRETLRRTLDALIAAQLVMPNPGYGHPLRPEYVLTERGRRVAPSCRKLYDLLRERELEEVGLKKWPLPVLSQLGEERRFSELQSRLDVTPRALTLALKDLEAADLVERRVTADYPPATLYSRTPRARPVAGAAEAVLNLT
jgi:DNA-binding HxlR family transcriptional regulator